MATHGDSLRNDIGTRPAILEAEGAEAALAPPANQGGAAIEAIKPAEALLKYSCFPCTLHLLSLVPPILGQVQG